MHARRLVPDAVAALAALQGDVVTREQVVSLGLTPSSVSRLVREGFWVRICSGVFRTAPGDPPWVSLAWAGVLIAGDRARLGGAAAGFLHDVVVEEPAEILVLSPVTAARPTVTGPWLFRRERAGVRDGRRVGDPPRISVEDTVLDLVDAASDTEAVVDVVTRAVQKHKTTASALVSTAKSRHRLRHRRVLSALLDDVDAGAHSPLELDFLHDVERAHGLPEGRRQASRRSTAVDVWYDDYGVLVELDGRVGHSGTDVFRDMDRDNSAAVEGLVTLRYGWADCHDRRCVVARQLGSVLQGRGWPGFVQTCPLCQTVHAV